MNPDVNQNKELITPGHFGCPGCGATLAMKHTLSVLGADTIVVIPAGCWSTLIGIYPYSCLEVPVVSVAFATTAAVASGIKSGLEIQGNDHTTVLAWAGDGGTFDIGLQALSGAAERNDDIIYICYDNEAYMNTGIQRSSATPCGGWTTTTPASALKQQNKKNIVGIMASHGIPYAATASISDPMDLKKSSIKPRHSGVLGLSICLLPVQPVGDTGLSLRWRSQDWLFRAECFRFMKFSMEKDGCSVPCLKKLELNPI